MKRIEDTLKHERVYENFKTANLPFSESEWIEITESLRDMAEEILGQRSLSGPEKGQPKQALYKAGKYLAFREFNSNYYSLQLIKAVSDSLNKPNMNFCDMGCGDGNVVYFAEQLGMNAIGVEYQSKLKECHEALDVDVLYGDFYDMDLSFLKEQDMVYLYWPVMDREGMRKLFELIYENTKEDVVVIFNKQGYGSDIPKFKGYEFVDDDLKCSILFK
jgi:hypothetical protein